MTVVYSDFRPVEDLQLPFRTRATFNGQPQPAQSATIDTISLNAPLEPSLFVAKSQGVR